MCFFLYVAMLAVCLVTVQCTADEANLPGDSGNTGESGKPAGTGKSEASSSSSSAGDEHISDALPANNVQTGDHSDNESRDQSLDQSRGQTDNQTANRNDDQTSGKGGGNSLAAAASTQGGNDENSSGNDSSSKTETNLTTKAATPSAGQGTLTDQKDHSPEREKNSTRLQIPTTTSEDSSQHQKSTPPEGADTSGGKDKGNEQTITSTTLADDVATPIVPTDGDKKINLEPTSVTSTFVPTKTESTSSTTSLRNISSVVKYSAEKDNSIGSLSLFALAALATFVVIDVATAY